MPRYTQPRIISIHAPPRGATGGASAALGRCTVISIHAPPRGATSDKYYITHERYISIHAPPRGATPQIFSGGSRFAFQFTPLREGRRLVAFVKLLPHNISIHAPPRGATSMRYTTATPTKYFNSRPSARGDQCALPRANGSAEFQFTPLREGRQIKKGRVHHV